MNPDSATGEHGSLLNRPEIEEMIERLAVRVHVAWMQQRTAEGWRWGPQHDAAAKRHPCLVDYDRLPENEKDTDRRTARTAIRGLLDLGFEINPPKPALSADRGHFAPLLQRLGGTEPIAPDELRRLWQQCHASPGRGPVALYQLLGARLLKQGEPILAYDVLAEGLAAATGPAAPEADDAAGTVRLRQLLALALAQSGAATRAEGVLLDLCEHGSATPETLGLLGRVYKDLAAKAATAAERERWLARAYERYSAGFARAESAYLASHDATAGGDASYCGINAATVQVLRNNLAEGRALAERVRQLCRDRRQRAGAAGADDYWLAATLAEAELIGGRRDDALAAYRAAAALAQGNWRELSSTRRQARLLAGRLGLEPGVVDHLFPPLAVAVHAAPAGAPVADTPELTGWASGLRAALARELADAGVVCAYAAVVAPADLVFAEAVLASGRELNLVLPAPRDHCRADFAAAPAWAARFDRVLAGAHAVTEDTQAAGGDETALRDFARQRAFGAGRLRAQRLDAALHVWAPAGERRPAPSRAPYPIFHYTVAAPAAPAGAAPAPAGERLAVRAMLFGDVKGYSKLDDAGLLRIANRFMGRVADILEPDAARILSRRTAGDGLFLVCADTEAAAAVALRLRDLVATTRWEEHGLPPGLGMRISLDAGPVFVFRDPVTGRDEVCGAFVNRAARIEPITPPNEVYASEAFAALQAATGGAAFRFDYVGQTQLPKGFGVTPLYCVNREPTTDPCSKD